MKKEEEEGVHRDGAQLNGRTNGPYGSDGSDVDTRVQDNKNREEIENSANGLDSVQVRGGQDGRNIRGIGSTDMDSKNGVLRMGDMDNSTMEVTEEGKNTAAADGAHQSKTSTIDAVPESEVNQENHGPDAIDEEIDKPSAKKETRQQADNESNSSVSNEDEDQEIGRTGTSMDHKPTY